MIFFEAFAEAAKEVAGLARDLLARLWADATERLKKIEVTREERKESKKTGWDEFEKRARKTLDEETKH